MLHQSNISEVNVDDDNSCDIDHNYGVLFVCIMYSKGNYLFSVVISVSQILLCLVECTLLQIVLVKDSGRQCLQMNDFC